MTDLGGRPAGPLETLRLHRGMVVAFDEQVGLGEVEDADDGGSRYQFHCTQITDGTRSIPVGADVTFSVVAGRRGAWQAATVTPLGET